MHTAGETARRRDPRIFTYKPVLCPLVKAVGTRPPASLAGCCAVLLLRCMIISVINA